MKKWLKKILRSESREETSALECFQKSYSSFEQLLAVRRDVKTLLSHPDDDAGQALQQALDAILESLNTLSWKCSLDLVKAFEQIQTWMEKNPLHLVEKTLPQIFQTGDYPKPGPFPIQNLHAFQDVFDYAQALAIEEMFNLPDRYDASWNKAIKIQTGLPLNLHIMDLGGGLKESLEKKHIPKENILSQPMQAMFRGMFYPGITWSGPIGISLKGLMVIMAQSSSRPEEDFWDKTYALLSKTHMNFISRLGYHYTSVSAYVSGHPDDNYIRFLFKGGAADEVRRARRARFIGAVLERLGFESMVQKDQVDARFIHRDRSEIELNLDMVGRLMGCIRQRDMVMNDDAIANWHTEAFLRGNYAFDPDK